MGNAPSFIKESSYVLDPDGEVTIILRNPNAPFAVSKSQESSESESEDTDSETESNHEQMDTDEAEGGGIESKGHVDASSDNPSQNNNDKKNEEEGSTLQENGAVEIPIEGWDTEAFLILMNIFHCRHSALPRTPIIEMMAKVGVLTDYYDCLSSVQIFADRFAPEIGALRSADGIRDWVLRLWIAWVFRQDRIWKDIFLKASEWFPVPIQTYGLPFPGHILVADPTTHRRKAVGGRVRH
ncbi:uncharacterized protein LDX57_010349 [Aspergillus melleus]|uniref:uncharacterized protein n=1 Tax=Aspergillus melleus TaxID=138277 RepID=UPI001E8EE2E8|nr:uncharacterized protein LDX57_010349 [Aspergillus melleus]KAH8432722.1 hypothetical protein LDX57_010349 [Aspergillus melleus]